MISQSAHEVEDNDDVSEASDASAVVGVAILLSVSVLFILSWTFPFFFWWIPNCEGRVMDFPLVLRKRSKKVRQYNIIVAFHEHHIETNVSCWLGSNDMVRNDWYLLIQSVDAYESTKSGGSDPSHESKRIRCMACIIGHPYVGELVADVLTVRKFRAAGRALKHVSIWNMLYVESLVSTFRQHTATRNKNTINSKIGTKQPLSVFSFYLFPHFPPEAATIVKKLTI